MSTIVDKYGREVDVQTEVDGEDVYVFEGNGVWFPTGTPQNVALATIEAMAPGWWTPPEPDQPIVEVGRGRHIN